MSGEGSPAAGAVKPSDGIGAAVFSAILFMVFAAALVQSRSFSPDAALFPRLIALVAMVSAAFALAHSLRIATTRPTESQTRAVGWNDLLISYAGPPVYLGMMVLFGFWIASAVFLAGLLVVLGTRNPVIVTLITGGTLALIYVAFELAFSIPLPGGVLFEPRF